MRIGRAWAEDPAIEPLPIGRLSGLARQLERQGGVASLAREAIGMAGGGRLQPLRIDEDGFRHFQGVPGSANGQPPSPLAGIARDLRHAVRADVAGSRR